MCVSVYSNFNNMFSMSAKDQQMEYLTQRIKALENELKRVNDELSNKTPK